MTKGMGADLRGVLFVVLGLRYYEIIETEVYAFKQPLGIRVLDVLV